MDKNARSRKKRVELELQTFYGRLEHILSFSLDSDNAISDLDLDGPTNFVFAAIRLCAVNTRATNERLDIHYYSSYGALDVVDIKCIQCVVGRVPIPEGGVEKWALVDRSGSLARAVAVDDV